MGKVNKKCQEREPRTLQGGDKGRGSRVRGIIEEWEANNARLITPLEVEEKEGGTNLG